LFLKGGSIEIIAPQITELKQNAHFCQFLSNKGERTVHYIEMTSKKDQKK